MPDLSQIAKGQQYLTSRRIPCASRHGINDCRAKSSHGQYRRARENAHRKLKAEAARSSETDDGQLKRTCSNSLSPVRRGGDDDMLFRRDTGRTALCIAFAKSVVVIEQVCAVSDPCHWTDDARSLAACSRDGHEHSSVYRSSRQTRTDLFGHRIVVDLHS